MKDRKLRKALTAFVDDTGMNIVILDSQSYDGAIVGITHDGRLVYDYEKMVHELEEEDGCSHEDAIEWIEYNTIRSLPYIGENAPVILRYGKDFIMEMYGSDEGGEGA